MAAKSSPSAGSTDSEKETGLRLPSSFVDIAGRFSILSVGNACDGRGRSEEPHVTCLLMLLACNYAESDVLTVLAMASANILRQADEFKQMGEKERAFVAAIHIYLAHIFVFDECVPLRYWHDWAFSSYCSFGCLNRALNKLLKLMQYRPVVAQDIVEHNTAYLRNLESAPDAPRASPLLGKW